MKPLPLDFLGLDPISDGIQHWCVQNADISQQDVDMRGNVASKLLRRRCEESRHVKEMMRQICEPHWFFFLKFTI
jgi:hypothetical protein